MLAESHTQYSLVLPHSRFFGVVKRLARSSSGWNSSQDDLCTTRVCTSRNLIQVIIARSAGIERSRRRASFESARQCPDRSRNAGSTLSYAASEVGVRTPVRGFRLVSHLQNNITSIDYRDPAVYVDLVVDPAAGPQSESISLCRVGGESNVAITGGARGWTLSSHKLAGM